MKSEWKKIPIKDLCIGFYDGPHATPPKSDSGAVFLGIPNFSNGRLDLSNVRYISEDDLPRWTKRVTPQAHDIVFSYEATLNLYAIIPDGFHGCLGRRMALMRPDESKVNYKFLYYYMFSSEWREEIERHKVFGSTVDRIPLISFPSFMVNLPDMATQEYIANILSALDEKIALNNKINENLEQQGSALIEYYMRGTETVASFADIMDFVSGFAFQSKTYLPSGKYQIITIKNVQDGYIDPSGAAFIDNLPLQMKTQCILHIGDVLLSLTGNVGRVGIVCETNLLLNQRVAKIVPKDKTLVPFLYFVYRQPEIKTQMTAIAKGTAQLNLSPVETLNLTIPYEKKSAVELSQMLTPLYQMIISNTQENVELTMLRNAVLPKLMSGKMEL